MLSLEQYAIEIAYISDDEKDKHDKTEKDDDHWNDLENYSENKEFFPITNLLIFKAYNLHCIIKVCQDNYFVLVK